MKLVLQIALGVFLGSLASQFTCDAWRVRQENIAKEAEKKLRAERDRVREQQAEKIRALLQQGLQGKNTGSVVIPPGFVPDDAQEPVPQTPGAE